MAYHSHVIYWEVSPVRQTDETDRQTRQCVVVKPAERGKSYVEMK